jgi:hypothetical protein
MMSILRVVLPTLGLAATTTSAQSVTTIRQIQFDNFTYAWNEPPFGVPVSSIKVEVKKNTSPSAGIFLASQPT